jgi:hypothetical protein
MFIVTASSLKVSAFAGCEPKLHFSYAQPLSSLRQIPSYRKLAESITLEKILWDVPIQMIYLKLHINLPLYMRVELNIQSWM